MIFVSDDWAKYHHDVYVMVVQLGDDAHGCAGGGRDRGGDRSGGGQLFGPQCGPDCREGAPDIEDRVNEVDATTRARMRASSSGSDCAGDTAERCLVTAASHPRVTRGAAER
jgi:hypothetical protein